MIATPDHLACLVEAHQYWRLALFHGNYSVTIQESTIRVGELLVQAAVVSSAEMTEAVQVSKRLGVPIGRVLIMSGCVREEVLEASLQLQRLIRAGDMSVEAALEALQRVNDLNIDLTEALANEQYKESLLDSAEYLGELLLDSNIVSEEDLVKAMQTSFDEGVPLGSTLVLQGLLSPSLFPSILSVQKNIARGVTTREEGVKEIQEIFLHWLKAEESLKRTTHDDRSDRISAQDDREFSANISESASSDKSTNNPNLTARTSSKSEPGTAAFATTNKNDSVAKDQSGKSAKDSKSSGSNGSTAPATKEVSDNKDQSAVTNNATNKEAKEPASAQNKTDAQPVGTNNATTSASNVNKGASVNNQNASAPAEEKRDADLRLVDLLKQSGIFSQAEVQKRYEALLRDPVRSGKFFVELGLIDENDLSICLRSHSLLAKGHFNKDEAIYAIRNDRVTSYEREISGVSDEKVKRYMDKQWRGRMSTVIGGALFGAVVAGLSMNNKRKK